jgi:hypothetical protein
VGAVKKRNDEDDEVNADNAADSDCNNNDHNYN